MFLAATSYLRLCGFKLAGSRHHYHGGASSGGSPACITLALLTYISEGTVWAVDDSYVGNCMGSIVCESYCTPSHSFNTGQRAGLSATCLHTATLSSFPCACCDASHAH